MSTFGREADRLAETRRRHQRRIAEKAIRLHDAVCFAIVILDDWEIPDAVARKTAFDALRIGRSA